MKNNHLMAGIAAGLILVLSLILFGIPGARALLTLFVLYALPVYLILDNFTLTQKEKLIYSLFIGLGIFPSFAYWISLKFTSLATASIITFAVLLAAAFGIKKYYGSYNSRSS